MLVSAETGKNQESAIGQRFFPIHCETQFFQSAGGTDDDGLASAQKNAETFFFHRRMKTADDAATSIAPAGGLSPSACCCARTGRTDNRNRTRTVLNRAKGNRFMQGSSSTTVCVPGARRRCTPTNIAFRDEGFLISSGGDVNSFLSFTFKRRLNYYFSPAHDVCSADRKTMDGTMHADIAI